MKISTPLALLALASIPFFGCSSSSNDDEGAGGASAGGASSGGSSAGGSGGTTAMGACSSAADMSAVEAMYDDGMGGMIEFGDIVRACGQGCLTAMDPDTCVTDCIAMDTNNAVSLECSTCYLGSFQCAVANCLAACAADPNDPGCDVCLCGMNDMSVSCIANLDECTGLNAVATTCT